MTVTKSVLSSPDKTLFVTVNIHWPGGEASPLGEGGGSLGGAVVGWVVGLDAGAEVVGGGVAGWVAGAERVSVGVGEVVRLGICR